MRLSQLLAPATLALLLPCSALAGSAYREVDLVSDLSGRAQNVDPQLVNPWGLTETPAGLVRVANNDVGSSTAYGPAGVQRGPVIDVGPGGEDGPTGIVANPFPGQFLIDAGGVKRSAQFIYATLDGSIRAWNERVGANEALQVSHDDAASYTGLAIGMYRMHAYLYGANFKEGAIEIYDTNFEDAHLPGDFSDPNLPADYAPFNVQNIDGHLFVAYAERGPEGDEEHGAGLGLVDEYDLAGHLLRRVATGGTLNAPWGLTTVPRGFGPFGGALLVGNFGDGRINAFDRRTVAFLGQLADPNGDPITISGLWGLRFIQADGDDDDNDQGNGHGNGHAFGHDKDHGNGVGNGNGHGRDRDASQRLYFAAGIEGETHGLFGYLAVANGGSHGDDLVASGDPSVAAATASEAVSMLRVGLVGPQPVRLSAGTSVSFRLAAPAGARVDLAVFDATGRRIAQPARGIDVGTGTELRWTPTSDSGQRLAPGAYFWRATAAGNTQTGRILLLP